MSNLSQRPEDPLADVPRERFPRHIAAIMDGNGRWAQQRGLPRAEGHRRGAQTVHQITEEANLLGIEQLTLYCLSSENWKRPPEELEFLMLLLREYLIEERTSIMEQNLQMAIIGHREGLPDEVLAEMDRTLEMSSRNTGLRLCLAINYGGRAEIVDAARRIAEEVRDGQAVPDNVTETFLADRLNTAGMPELDLMIRTAGEMRVSNFLLWQLSYAEIWVTDRCWPDFDEPLLHEAIRAYAGRDRRFGGLNG